MKTLLALLASTTLLFSQTAFDPLSKSNINMQVAVTKSSSDGPRELKITLSSVGNTPQPTTIEVFRLIKNKKDAKEVRKQVVSTETGVGEFPVVFPELLKGEYHRDWMVRVVRNDAVVSVAGKPEIDKLASK